MTHGVLVYIVRDGKLLLVKGRQPDPARWNGIGTAIRSNERAHDAAVRAVKECVGLKVDPGLPLGTVTYHHPTFGHWDVTMFRASKFKGHPEVRDHTTPAWFDPLALPFPSMWPGDPMFMYRILEDKPFTIEVWFDDKNVISKQHVEFS